jgi:hypothetical protein
VGVLASELLEPLLLAGRTGDAEAAGGVRAEQVGRVEGLGGVDIAEVVGGRLEDKALQCEQLVRGRESVGVGPECSGVGCARLATVTGRCGKGMV